MQIIGSTGLGASYDYICNLINYREYTSDDDLINMLRDKLSTMEEYVILSQGLIKIFSDGMIFFPNKVFDESVYGNYKTHQEMFEDHHAKYGEMTINIESEDSYITVHGYRRETIRRTITVGSPY